MKRISEDLIVLRFCDENKVIYEFGLDSILDSGMPVDAESGDELDYLGVYITMHGNADNESGDQSRSPCDISLEHAFRVLEECSAISMEDGELLYPSLSDLEGSDDNEFAYFEWEDDEGLVFSARFEEGNNQSVTVSSNLMTLIDTEGEEVTFYVLCPMDIESFLLSMHQKPNTCKTVNN